VLEVRGVVSRLKRYVRDYYRIGRTVGPAKQESRPLCPAETTLLPDHESLVGHDARARDVFEFLDRLENASRTRTECRISDLREFIEIVCEGGGAPEGIEVLEGKTMFCTYRMLGRYLGCGNATVSKHLRLLEGLGAIKVERSARGTTIALLGKRGELTSKHQNHSRHLS
jgi:hypothetical protein